MSHPFLSVVVPTYNEQSNIVPLYKKLLTILSSLKSYELIYVNDGSSDETLEQLQRLAKDNPHVRVISFSRNFGKEAATSAGLHYATGEGILMIDADGQFPPEFIPQFIEKWQAGAQVVTGVRTANHKEGLVKRQGSKLFYRILNMLGGVQMKPGSTDFRLIDRSVQQQFTRFTERSRMTRGLLDWAGFSEEYIYFQASARVGGDPGYKTSKLVKLAMNSFISLSYAPLYLSIYAGLIITPLALLTGIFVIVEQLILGDPWHLDFTGTAMLGIMLLFFLGIMLIAQGLSALYISHIHIETQNRPLYVVDERHSVRL
ncbi:MAG TPA: glycosyltransferase family 2 protein [Bacillota bacterium]|nr:glycosyltransferase family 2 protein [Bacillota bacterium]